MARHLRLPGLCLFAALSSGCAAVLPTIGPSRSAIDHSGIEIITIDDSITRELLSKRAQHLFSETLGNVGMTSRKIGPGDVLEVTIWEASPATLFNNSAPALSSNLGTSRPATLPEQSVDDDGTIVVPFAGRIQAAGKSLQQVEADITDHLRGKANQPEILVRLTKNFSANATIVGEVNASTRVPLIPGNERLLDAIAAAAGVRQPVNKMTIQVTRASHVYSLPLETIIRDPQQNVPLQPGDVVTALFQPFSFTALGATGKNEEINFETQGISLAQALARSGGLLDSRSNPKGVFIFRFLPRESVSWPQEPTVTTPEGLVPTVFRIDLSDPKSFFLIQSFPIENRDIVYVSNAPMTEVQKFLNIVFEVAYPVLAIKQVN